MDTSRRLVLTPTIKKDTYGELSARRGPNASLPPNMSAVEKLTAFKDEGNVHYKNKDYPAAIASYSKGVACLPEPADSDDESPQPAPGASPELLKAGAVILCNRAAAYMGANKPIPALADGQRASGTSHPQPHTPSPTLPPTLPPTMRWLNATRHLSGQIAIRRTGRRTGARAWRS